MGTPLASRGSAIRRRALSPVALHVPASVIGGRTLQRRLAPVWIVCLHAGWVSCPQVVSGAEDAPARTLFFDGFRRDSGAWQPLVGEWAVDDRQRYRTTGEPRYMKASIVEREAWDRCEITVDLPALTQTVYGRGILFGYWAPDDFWFFWTCDVHDKLELARYSEGRVASLANTSRPIQTGEDYALKVVIADRVECHLDGEMVLTYDSYPGEVRGKVGVMTYLVDETAFFDDFRVVERSDEPPPDALLVRGDGNQDGRVDISDAIETLAMLFVGRGDLTCEDAVDANDDGTVDVSDAIATLVALFAGEGSLPPPGVSGCGVDPTDDGLSCDWYAPCGGW